MSSCFRLGRVENSMSVARRASDIFGSKHGFIWILITFNLHNYKYIKPVVKRLLSRSFQFAARLEFVYFLCILYSLCTLLRFVTKITATSKTELDPQNVSETRGGKDL